LIRILMLGDVVGEPGRRVLRNHLSGFVAEREVDFVVVNGENVAGGAGITPVLLDKLLASGIDVVTTGDHVYRRREIYEALQGNGRLLRPLNMPRSAVGRGSTVVESRSGARIAVVNLLGRVFMDPAECPFAAIDAEIGKLDAPVVIVDMHAEATSEKVAMGRYLDGRTTIVAGSHTHIPTADECILPGGTAYITDLGMTGPYDSVLGRRVEPVLKRFRTGMPIRFPVAEGDRRASGILVEANEVTGKATAIERVTIRDP
jgi:metallophosphoesterase (TIGR00282 family)